MEDLQMEITTPPNSFIIFLLIYFLWSGPTP
jgi:hypothetical protein